MRNSIAALLGAILFLYSCSSVRIFKDPEMTQNTGFKYYTVKPFIQVERDAQSNAVLKSTIIYLPDLANPQYLKVKDGIGSSKLDIDLNNGSIEKLGLTTDSKIPEYIKAVASTISESAGAIKDLSGLKGMPPSVSQSTVVELYDIIMDSEGTHVKKIDLK